jgi:S-DNA-T family DNA segregation ATPase FtsK/SpoIIIE
MIAYCIQSQRQLGGFAPEFKDLFWIKKQLHLPIFCRTPVYFFDPFWMSLDLDYGDGGVFLADCSTANKIRGKYDIHGHGYRPTANEVKRMAREGPPVVETIDGLEHGKHGHCIRAFQRTQNLATRPPEPDLNERGSKNEDWRYWLRHVKVGVRADGGTWRVSLIDNHILITGITDAGKSSVMWSIVAGVAPAIEWGVARIHALDPKRMELAIGRECFASYAAGVDDMVDALRWAVQTMEDRTEELAGRARKFTPARAMPLEIIMIDELGYLLSLIADRKAQGEVKQLLTTLLVLGRAAGICVVGGVQDPRKEVIESRDLWPTKIAMRLSRDMVRLVLGSDALEAGARCDLITPDMAGTAFVLGDAASGAPVQVRAFWLSDADIQRLQFALAPYASGWV